MPEGELLTTFECLPERLSFLNVGNPRDSFWPEMMASFPEKAEPALRRFSGLNVPSTDEVEPPDLLTILGVPKMNGSPPGGDGRIQKASQFGASRQRRNGRSMEECHRRESPDWWLPIANRGRFVLDSMPDPAWNPSMSIAERPSKPLVWLHGEVKTPPFSRAARLEAGCFSASSRTAIRSGCRIHGPCRASGHAVMSCEYEMRSRTGALSTALIPMPS